MNKDELLDLVNEKDEVIGEVWKSEAHKDPSKIHREVAIAVFNDRGEILIQQRSLDKKNDPGEWKISAVGHVDAGEEPKHAVERELFEELGIKVEAKFYKKIIRKRISNRGNKESRFVYMYYVIVKGKPKIILEKDEVENAIWIKPSDLIKFARQNKWDLEGLSHMTIMEIKDELML